MKIDGSYSLPYCIFCDNFVSTRRWNFIYLPRLDTTSIFPWHKHALSYHEWKKRKRLHNSFLLSQKYIHFPLNLCTFDMLLPHACKLYRQETVWLEISLKKLLTSSDVFGISQDIFSYNIKFFCNFSSIFFISHFGYFSGTMKIWEFWNRFT